METSNQETLLTTFINDNFLLGSVVTREHVVYRGQLMNKYDDRRLGSCKSLFISSRLNSSLEAAAPLSK